MRVVVVPEPGGGGRYRDVDDTGAPLGPPVAVADLAGAVRAREPGSPRWVWPDTTAVYPDLLAAGVPVARSGDLALTEGLLLGAAGRGAEPRGLAAATARLAGVPAPPDPPAGPRRRDEQPALFEPEPPPLPGGRDPLDAAVAVHADQQRRLAADDRLRLLVAAESAGALAAAEMSATGLPWRADVHTALLDELLGGRPVGDARPPRLARLAEQVADALGTPVDPDRPASVVAAFRRAGVELTSTRAHELRGVDHPAVAPLLEHKELSRLHAAHGWGWLATWVRDGRFHPEYVVGGVVSGRWATRGGAALQLPAVLRRAVVADPGRVLVVADAAQLEPRVLGALAGDDALAAAAGTGDLYRALADDAFDGRRDRAKVALLSAVYGATAGEAGALLAVLRRRYPRSMAFVEDAAAAGERGERVRSVLGRTSPAPSWAATPGDDEAAARRAAREWGRFTRNFVVQASAADWALVLLAGLRRRLRAAPGLGELVFFQHDEVVVHCPAETADRVAGEVRAAADGATRLVFPGTPVRFPLSVATVRCYADAAH